MSSQIKSISSLFETLPPMFIEQSYDIYPQCQKFLLDFGFTQDGDNFTYTKLDEVLGVGNIQFEFPKRVTDKSIKILCYNFTHLISLSSDDDSYPESTTNKVNDFCDFIHKIKNLFSGDTLMIMNQSITIATMIDEIRNLNVLVQAQSKQ